MSRTIVSTTNVSRPGEDPLHGDTVTINYSDETKETFTFTSVESTVEEDELDDFFIITKAAFLDRLDIDDKLDTIYAMEQLGLRQDPPNTTLFKALDNVRQREFIDLKEARIRPTLESLGIYTEQELNDILKKADVSEIPGIYK